MDGQAVILRGFLEKNAAERPDADALVTRTSRISYRDLHQSARAAAGAMQDLGLRHGDHVAILMGNDEKWLSLFYGAALIGAVTVPVNTRFKTNEIDFCLKKSDAKTLFYVSRFLSIDFEAMLVGIKPGIAIEVSDGVPVGQYRDTKVEAGDPLLIQFTSGTTAYPKGALLTHENMLRDALEAGKRIGVRPEDRYFNCRPFFHAAGST
ncbi:MAG: AMP-binding protein, partial [Clostridia bacterium]